MRERCERKNKREEADGLKCGSVKYEVYVSKAKFHYVIWEVCHGLDPQFTGHGLLDGFFKYECKIAKLAKPLEYKYTSCSAF